MPLKKAILKFSRLYSIKVPNIIIYLPLYHYKPL